MKYVGCKRPVCQLDLRVETGARCNNEWSVSDSLGKRANGASDGTDCPGVLQNFRFFLVAGSFRGFLVCLTFRHSTSYKQRPNQSEVSSARNGFVCFEVVFLTPSTQRYRWYKYSVISTCTKCCWSGRHQLVHEPDIHSVCSILRQKACK